MVTEEKGCWQIFSSCNEILNTLSVQHLEKEF